MIKGANAIFLLILSPYKLGDFLKVKSKNRACVVIGSPDTIFLLILRHYTSGDLLKIKLKKTRKIARVR